MLLRPFLGWGSVSRTPSVPVLLGQGRISLGWASNATGSLLWGRCNSNAPGAANIFDRRAKMKQRNRAAMLPDAEKYDYLKDRVSWGGRGL